MRRLVLAFVAALLAMVPSLANAGRHGEVVQTISDKINYQKGQYTAFNAPYCVQTADPAKQCYNFVRGVDFADSTDVRPSAFPARSTIRWSWPAGRAAIGGYMQLIHGNYDNTVPQVAVPSVQLSALQTFRETFAISTTGPPADFNVLSEFYLTKQAGIASSKDEEVGFFYNISDVGLTYFNGATDAGTCNDGARNWSVHWKLDGSARIYIMLYTGAQLYGGTIDRKLILTCLIGKALVDPTHYINGTALGVEPVRGSGSMTVADWSVVLN